MISPIIRSNALSPNDFAVSRIVSESRKTTSSDSAASIGSAAQSVAIHVDQVAKRFGNHQALANVSLSFGAGELTALLGPSGSGKTTLLRTIAGIEAPDKGRILFGDDEVTWRPIRLRNVGFVFQNYALFEHLSVFDNVAFGLSVKKTPKPQIAARVKELLERVELGNLAHRLPRELSGGQRQRVALARALAPSPRVLLLDEPFGALDARVRRELREWLRKIHEEIHVTSILVTHDQEEAFATADRVVVMHDGKIEQVGTPTEIADHPATPFVRGFIEPRAAGVRTTRF